MCIVCTLAQGSLDCHIGDFGSDSAPSPDSDGGGEGDPPALLTLKNRRSRTFKSFRPQTNSYVDSDLGLQCGGSICSPPSSPEVEGAGPDLSTLKTSDWIKQVHTHNHYPVPHMLRACQTDEVLVCSDAVVWSTGCLATNCCM